MDSLERSRKHSPAVLTKLRSSGKLHYRNPSEKYHNYFWATCIDRQGDAGIKRNAKLDLTSDGSLDADHEQVKQEGNSTSKRSGKLKIDSNGYAAQFISTPNPGGQGATHT